MSTAFAADVRVCPTSPSRYREPLASCPLAIRGTGTPGFAGKTAYDLARARGMEDLSRELR